MYIKGIRLRPGTRKTAKKTEKRRCLLEITELEETSNNEYNVKRAEGRKMPNRTKASNSDEYLEQNEGNGTGQVLRKVSSITQRSI